MARGLWKGAISFGLVNVPVELHSAEKRSSELDLTMLDRREDFRRANVEAAKTVEILGFVELGEIPPLYFETPYYLAPGKRGEKAYALLRETLKKSGKAGIATVVIRTRQYLAALLPRDEVLVLNTLRYAGELKEVGELGVPSSSLKGPKVTAKEIDMALLRKSVAQKQEKPKRSHRAKRRAA